MREDYNGIIPARVLGQLSSLHDLPESSYRELLDQIPQMIWSTRPDGYHDYYNLRWYEFTGMPVGSTDGAKWNGMFHDDDQAKSWEIWHHSLANGEPYEVEYRLRHHSGQYRWTLGRAMPIRDADGTIMRWVGTCTDIHEQKQLIEINALLVGELSHRIKNIFAVVNALISLSSTGQPEHADFARVLQNRITALGSAHEFVRPHSDQSRPTLGAPTLFGMIGKIFAAVPAFRNGKISVHGDDMKVDDQAATPLALVFHELMTNALKYGALAHSEGEVEIAVSVNDEHAMLSWRETVQGVQINAPTQTGFGSQLIELSIEGQLVGTFLRQWTETGLVIEMRIPLSSVHR